jgi:hypothetical protein
MVTKRITACDLGAHRLVPKHGLPRAREHAADVWKLRILDRSITARLLALPRRNRQLERGGVLYRL